MPVTPHRPSLERTSPAAARTVLLLGYNKTSVMTSFNKVRKRPLWINLMRSIDPLNLFSLKNCGGR